MSTWLGIDVGRATVKVAMVRSAYRRVALESLFSADIDEATPVEAAIRTAVTAALGKESAADAVAAALDGSRASIHTVSLPGNALKQIAEVLPFELEAQVPIELEESVFDYRVLPGKPGAEEEGQNLSVLVAVARVEDVKARIELVKAATTVEPERIEIGGMPLANLLPHLPALAEAEPVVVVDIDEHSSEVVVFVSGDAVFSRTLSCGTSGLPASAAVLGREIRVSIGSFRASGGAQPGRVYLSGKGAYESGAVRFLTAELGLPCDVLPAPALDVTAVDPNRVLEIARFAKAIGLAVGLSGRAVSLDLRRGPLAYERGFAWVREKVPMLAGLGATILVSFFFSGWAQLHAAANDREVLEKALSTVSREVLGEEVTSAARATELLNQQTSISDEDPLPHSDAFDVMVKLSEDIPQSMVHDIEELDVQKGHVTIHGVVGSIPDAQSIATSLRAERCLSDVKITRTTQVVGGDRQKYLLEFDLKCPEDVKGSAKKKEGGGAAASPSGSAGGK
jgi:general secretion pathway protein L